MQFATTAQQKAAAPKPNTDSRDEHFRAFVYLVCGGGGGVCSTNFCYLSSLTHSLS